MPGSWRPSRSWSWSRRHACTSSAPSDRAPPNRSAGRLRSDQRFTVDLQQNITASQTRRRRGTAVLDRADLGRGTELPLGDSGLLLDAPPAFGALNPEPEPPGRKQRVGGSGERDPPTATPVAGALRPRRHRGARDPHTHPHVHRRRGCRGRGGCFRVGTRTRALTLRHDLDGTLAIAARTTSDTAWPGFRLPNLRPPSPVVINGRRWLLDLVTLPDLPAAGEPGSHDRT